MYTRCPECHTTFRIGAADLQRAGGRVRCGHCGSAFDALASLGETPADLAGETAASAGPPRFEQRYGDDGPTLEDTASRWHVLEAPAEDVDDWEEPDEPSPDDAWAAGLTLPPRALADSEASLQAELSLEASDLIETDARLSPEGSWEADDTADDTADDMETAAPETTALEPEASLDIPHLQPEEDARQSEETVDIDEAPAGVAALERPITAQRPRRLVRWTGGLLAAGLCLALVAQLVHQYRETLAVHPLSADWVARLYETLGQPLYPAWPLEDYHLRARDDAALSLERELEIVATLSNRGVRPLPPPLIRLTLLDRWGAPMGSRVFTPQDYLAGRTPARMAPGQQLQATLAVRAPEGELYGYRLDICRPLDTDTLRCDAQAR